MNQDEVVDNVRRFFDQYRHEVPGFPSVEIVLAGVKEDRGWYYVPVARRDTSLRAYHYYDHLNAIETRLRRELGLDVLFVPARPTSPLAA
ncbi:MAG: hypothetical protein HUU35_00720 [Armatimonadetes bacterium]|nr:hypothetical protein [Armatimonadota bacterium]